MSRLSSGAMTNEEFQKILPDGVVANIPINKRFFK
jgi:hypothetical protein